MLLLSLYFRLFKDAMTNFKLVFVLALIAMSAIASAQQSLIAKKLILGVDWVPEANVEVLVTEGRRFNSVTSLKKYLGKQPAGSTVEWDPGCVRVGNNPLLSSGEEINDLREFLEKRGITFVVFPAG